METFQSHPSVRYTKEVTSDTKFSFQHVLSWETYQTIIRLIKNKATSGNIPTKMRYIHSSDWLYKLTYFNGVFPDELKLPDVIPLYKKSDSEDKTNYRPISVLPSLSKVSEKIQKHLNSFFETKLSFHVDFVWGIVHNMLYLNFYLIGKILLRKIWSCRYNTYESLHGI